MQAGHNVWHSLVLANISGHGFFYQS